MAKYGKSGGLAPNAGFSGGAKAVSENHGVGMGLGVGKKTADAKIEDWGSMPYVMDQQYSTDSMNYNAHKKSVAQRDASRLKKHMKSDADQEF